MTKQERRLVERQFKAAGRIIEIAAKVSNAEIEGEMDSLFANVSSACWMIRERASRELGQPGAMGEPRPTP